MTVLVWGGICHALDSNGDPVSGAKLYTYAAGTTTPATTYSDAALTASHTNPVIADSAGRFATVYALRGSYKLRLTDASDVLIYEDDAVEIEDTSASIVTNEFSTVTALLADATLSYTAGPGLSEVAADDVVRIPVLDFLYKVAASGAADHDITTSGGVKLYAQPVQTGGYRPDQWLENASPGTTDMTAAIQSAITKGDTDLHGQYLTSATVAIPSNRAMVGYTSDAEIIASTATWAVYSGLDVVNKGGFTNGSKPILSNTEPETGNSNIVLRGFTINGNPTGPNHMFHVRTISGLTIDRMKGVDGLSAFAILKSTDVSITNSTVEAFTNGGFDTWEGCSRVQIIGNRVNGANTDADDSNIGIFVTAQPTDGTDSVNHTASDYIISGNHIFGGENHGIWCGGGVATRGGDSIERVQIFGNNIRDCDGTGIIIEQGEHVTIDNNHLTEIGEHGIFARTLGGSNAVDFLRITGNTLKNIGGTVSGSDAISLDTTVDDATIIGNTVTGSTHDYALYIRGTNTRATYHSNNFAAGVSGTTNDLATASRTLPRAGGVDHAFAWNSGLVGSSATVSNVVAITGVKIGDYLRVVTDGDFGGLTFSWEITATDEITFYLENETGAGINPDSQNIRVWADRLLNSN